MSDDEKPKDAAKGGGGVFGFMLGRKRGEVSAIFDAINRNDEKALSAALLANRAKESDPYNAYDEWGHTPLHIAAALGKGEMCRFLCSHKGTRVNIRANPEHKNQEQRTPLHLAAISCDVDTVKVLLEHGANTAVVDVSGLKPAHLAGNDAIKRRIQAAGETTASCVLAQELVNRFMTVNQLRISRPVLNYEEEHIKRFHLTYEAIAVEIKAFRKTLGPGDQVPPIPKAPTNKQISDTVTQKGVGQIYVVVPRKQFGVSFFGGLIRCADTEYDGEMSFLIQDIWVAPKLRGQRLGCAMLLHTLINYTQKQYEHALVYIPQVKNMAVQRH